MSRAIKLSRIHAINWYGYNDSLAVEGNLLLAGVTGSGKSVLMDLIMTVLVGTDVAHNHFNRSATGAQSDRNLKSYCLLDTKREENGVAQYQRDKGAITYIALEFTWPVKDNAEPRVETWGLRIEFRNAAELHGHIRAFYCGNSLSHDDFLVMDSHDGKKRVLELAPFRRFIEEQCGGRLFDTQDQFLRDMANQQHLNFNREVLASLLPQAMAFTNRKSFDQFIRDFVLPGDRLDVSDVVGSYRSFQAYERDLQELHDQLKRLENIRELFQSFEGARRDRTVARWLVANLKHRYATAIVRETETHLRDLRTEFEKELKRIGSLEMLIRDRRTEIEQLRNMIRTSAGGDLYLFIKDRNKTICREIETLRAIGTRVDDALRDRVRRARRWLTEVRSLKLSLSTESLESGIKHLEGCDAAASEGALRAVAEQADKVRAALSEAIRPSREELDGLRKTIEKLRQEIGALELGKLPFPTALLQSLLDQLPRRSREHSAQVLCRLCELTDETWRVALELAFTGKFAIVVTQEDYEQALRIYHDLNTDSPQESLIDPSRALRLNCDVQSGSLAEKLRAEHPVVRAVINHLFGDLMCAESLEEFSKHESAILPNGFMRRGAIVQGARHYDGLPFVGRRALEQQLGIKRSQRKDAETNERRLEPRVADAQNVIEQCSRSIPEHASLTRDLAEAQRLPALEKELSDNTARLNAIDHTRFDELDRQVTTHSQELDAWDVEHRQLIGSQKRGEIQRVEGELKDAKDNEAHACATFDRIQQEIGDISVHASRLNEWRDEVAATHPPLDASAHEFERLEAQADKNSEKYWQQLVAARRELALVYPKFDELVPDNPSNEHWEKLWQQIAQANIPDYEQKAKIERARWEHLFRNNVLQKLDRALHRLRNDVVLLNGHLKTPIGNDLYEIDIKANPEFKTLRELVSLNTMHQRDELFYAAVDGQMRATLDRFLGALVDEPDSMEAAHLLDYRCYHDYDLLVRDIRDTAAKPISVDRQSGKMSGGENQSPYFVVILASYLRAYKRHETRWKDPSLALVPIDEAFSKMDTGRIKDCIEAIKDLDLQGIFSMSTGNLPGAFELCDQLIIVSRSEDRRNGRAHVRNVPVSILRHSEEGREWMQEHAMA